MDWIIVGGGIHGVHVAARLIDEGGVSPEQLTIVDPGETLLERWRQCTQAVGMTHLRSPAVHNVDTSPFALHQFGRLRRRRPNPNFAAPYNRPALRLFNRHCEAVIARLGLDARHLRDRVETIELGSVGASLRLRGGELRVADRVVLALGAPERLRWPDWARERGDRVQHVFQRDLSPPGEGERVVVIGGGISAAQLALRASKQGGSVTVLARHPMRIHQFDSSSKWLGPNYMEAFWKVQCPQQRRRIIGAARRVGSVPPGLAAHVRRAEKEDRLRWHQGEVQALRVGTDDVHLRLADGSELSADRVLLATGFSSERPGGEMLGALVESSGLPCAQCGYPLVDKALRWHPRLFVTGALAELELGPVSRNIAGARKAAERIVAA